MYLVRMGGTEMVQQLAEASLTLSFAAHKEPFVAPTQDDGVTLNRKLDLDTERLVTTGRVVERCRDIWFRGLKAGRRDSFIGLMNVTNGKVYLAPCFGAHDTCFDAPRNENAAKGKFRNDKEESKWVMQADTSVDAAGELFSRREVEQAYHGVRDPAEERCNVCYVPLGLAELQAGNFGTQSHDRFLD
jgi:hypothetical protein